MSEAHAVPAADTVEPVACGKSNVHPLRARRATLVVYLTGAAAHAHLPALLRSAVGSHVTNINSQRERVRVTLDIAPEDFTRTLHTLIATLPEATIGSIVRRAGTAQAVRPPDYCAAPRPGPR